ncbi:alpha-galactosidase [Streptomyces sp. TLI_105]|uniref:alpha-galactosidase n=1 Tax=Streptomyces sp. TLI_105 TaxID=1881019 RepID=UPI000A608AB4
MCRAPPVFRDGIRSGTSTPVQRAAALGVELYVVDDGWFGAGHSDRAGLADWRPSPDRFPQGLGPLSDAVHGLGMRFGIWVEPEMVNPDSDLYRARPDWVLHTPGRTRSELRHQLVLDFARDGVADRAYDWLTRLVDDHGVDFLKWGMNRAFSEAGPTAAPTKTTVCGPPMGRTRTASWTGCGPPIRICGSRRAAMAAGG